MDQTFFALPEGTLGHSARTLRSTSASAPPARYEWSPGRLIMKAGSNSGGRQDDKMGTTRILAAVTLVAIVTAIIVVIVVPGPKLNGQ